MSVGALSAGLASYDFSDCDHPAQRGPISIFVMHLIIGTGYSTGPLGLRLTVCSFYDSRLNTDRYPFLLCLS